MNFTLRDLSCHFVWFYFEAFLPELPEALGVAVREEGRELGSLEEVAEDLQDPCVLRLQSTQSKFRNSSQPVQVLLTLDLQNLKLSASRL